MFESPIAPSEDARGIGLEAAVCSATGAPAPDSIRSVELGGDDAVAAALEAGPGPWSMTLLCTVPVAELSEAGRLDYIRALEQLASWATALAAAIVEHVGPEPIARDGTCIFPGCRHPAHRSALDHRTPWQQDSGGGSTSADNLASLCRRHHRLKTFAGWTLRGRAESGFEWTSPSGQKWVVPPRRVLGGEGSATPG